MDMFNILLQYRKSWLYDIPRVIFSWIDRGVYWLIARLYNLIVDLAYIKVFDNQTLGDFYTKVYGLLSIVMLFKVTFSVVSYILDPSKMSDKQQGFGKIITNILVMFVMLISCPTAFNMLYQAQDAILSDNIIPNFIFGDDATTTNSTGHVILLADADTCNGWFKYSNVKNLDFNTFGVNAWRTSNTGDYIAMMIFRPFFSLGDTNVASNMGMPLESAYPMPANAFCIGSSYITSTGESDPTTGILNINSMQIPGNGVIDFEVEYKDFSSENFVPVREGTVSKMLNYVNDYHAAYNTSNDFYYIDYKFFVSTAVGVYVALMFLTLAFDIAVRAVQLSFLQLIAPIPIISYIDPASGKNGTFSKWIKNVGKTWASLFIRLFAIFFAVFVISKIDENLIANSFEGTGKTPESSDFFIVLFITIGALMFAKKLPQLIEELVPGMKMGKMQLNPFKKIADEAVGGKFVLGQVAGAAAGAAAGATNFAHRTGQMFNKNNYKNADGKYTTWSVLGGLGKGVGRTIGSTIAGQASAGFRAWTKTAKDGKIGTNIVQGHQSAMYAKVQREDNRRKGGSIGGSMKADLQRYAGILNDGQREYLRAAELDQIIKNEQDELDTQKRAMEQDKKARLEPYTQYANYASKIKDIIDNDSDVKDAQKKYEEAKASGNRHQIELWSRGLKSAKETASIRILRDNQEARAYVQRMEELRNQNDSLKASDYDYIKSDGSFNSGSINNTKSQERIISLDYEDRERAFAQRQAEIEAMKHTEEYIRTHQEVTPAKTDNASRHVQTGSGQPAGWPCNPHGPRDPEQRSGHRRPRPARR